MSNVSKSLRSLLTKQTPVTFRFHLNERDGTITFEDFLSYFPGNEVRELIFSNKYQLKNRISLSSESQT